MRAYKPLFFAIALAIACPARAEPVVMEFFRTHDCGRCERIHKTVLLPLKNKYGRQLELRELDSADPAQAPRLAHYRDKLAREEQHPSSTTAVLNGKRLFEYSELRSADFGRAVADFVAQNKGAAPALAPHGPDAVFAEYAKFTAAGIAVAGFVDGINPCAISAFVFLASLLAVSRRRRRDMAVMGAAFCAAAFATYFLVGLGVFGAFRKFAASGLARVAVLYAMFAALLLLAAFSAADAARFGRSGRADAVKLKLPPRLQRLSHKIMREGVKTRSAVLGGFSAGAATTLVESVCTGQVYLPILAAMAELRMSARVVALLALYNAMFILPLAAVLAAFLAGARIPAILNWSAKHVALSKWTMALFFLLLAGFAWIALIWSV
jgi:Cytochrome c biogenesis protein